MSETVVEPENINIEQLVQKIKTKINNEQSQKKQQQILETEYSEDNFEEEKEEKKEEEPTGPKVMKFTFTPEKLMMQMNKQLLKKLRSYWESKTDGLDIVEFSQLILSRIHTHNDDEKYELIYGCYKLFVEIDVNGNGLMEWGEFLQYIIEAVTGSGVNGGEDQDSVREQLIQLRAQKYTKFDRSLSRLDKSKHKDILQKSIDCSSSNIILAHERFGKDMKFYDEKMCLIRKIEVPFKKEAFIQHIAYDSNNMIFACTSTDSNMYFYKKGRVQIEFYKMIEAPCIQSRIWYMPKQKFWLTAGRDFKVRHWSIEKQRILLNELFIKHTDEITDCVEILNPLCIATCSLDQSIVLWDVEQNEILTRITDYHEKGIRVLCYQKENGGNMISIGNETYANVWTPESLVSDMHNGRLIGHTKSIIDGKFLNNAPFFITIDISNLIIIWDIKTQTSVQQISNKFKSDINGIVVVKNNNFWLYGKRFFQFDTLKCETNEKIDKYEDADEYPVSALLNEFMSQVLVVMKQEVKMYDIQTGILVSIYNNVFKESDGSSDITVFKLDKKHRCAYVSNNKGRIYVINCQNGVFMKNVTQYQEDYDYVKIQNKKIEKDDGGVSDICSSNSYQSDEDQMNIYEKIIPKKKAKNTEHVDSSDDYSVINDQDDPQINDMILIQETYENDKELFMMIYSTQKEFFVYDESDLEESRLLRRIYGAHQEEITILAYDFHLSLIATGCVNGEIALFDFEMSRLEGILIGHTGDITAIEFAKPYPIMISASMDNTVCIWGVRPIAIKLQNICLKRFENISWDYQSMNPCPISKMIVWCFKEAKGIKRFRHLKDKELLPAPTYRIFEHNWVFGVKSVDQIWEEEFAMTRISMLGSASENEKFEAAITSKTYQEVLEDGKSKVFLTQGDRNEEYNDTLNEEKNRIYLFLGDELGFLKIWNLTDIILNLGIKPCKNMTEINQHTFNPFRSERIDISEMAKTIRATFTGQVMPLPINPTMTGILIRQTKAHMEVISSLQKIDLDDFKGLITCGKDNKVRNWNLELDLLGNINQNSKYDDPKWKFPSKLNEHKQIEEIRNIEKLIDDMQDGKNRMGLKFDRRKLIYDNNKLNIGVDDKIKTKANWFSIQNEQQKQKEENQEFQLQRKRDQEFENARIDLHVNKIERNVLAQDIKTHQLQMTFPTKLQDGMFRDLQNQLNSKQKALTEGLKQELAEYQKNKLKLQPKFSNLKLKRRGTSTQLTLEMRKQKSINQSSKNVLMQINSPTFTEDSSLSSPIKLKTKKELLESDMLIYKQIPTEKEKLQEKKDLMLKNLDAKKQYQAPTPKRKIIDVSQMIQNSKFNDSPDKVFDVSKNDRQNILNLQNIPKIRNICNTLAEDPQFKINASPSQIEKQNNKRYKIRVKGRKNSEAIPNQKNLVGMTFKTRPLSIAVSEIQQINDNDDQLLIKNNSQRSFDTYDESRFTSLPQIRQRNQSALQSQKDTKIKHLSILNKIQKFPDSFTTPQSPLKSTPFIQDRIFTANASIDNILKQDHSKIVSIAEEQDHLNLPSTSTNQFQSSSTKTPFTHDHFTLKKDISNIVSSNMKNKNMFDYIKLPAFSQVGTSIPKIITRNPINIYNTSSQVSNEAAIDYVLKNERRKKELFSGNYSKQYSQITPFDVTSTRHNTEIYDISNVVRSGPLQLQQIKQNRYSGQIQDQNQIIKNYERSKSQMKPSSFGIIRSQKMESNKSGSISPRDLVQNQKFQIIKEKYLGQSSLLINEKKLNQERLEQQRSAMAELRNNYKNEGLIKPFKALVFKPIQLRKQIKLNN